MIRDLCLDCKHMYFESIWNEATCEVSHKLCYDKNEPEEFNCASFEEDKDV